MLPIALPIFPVLIAIGFCDHHVSLAAQESAISNLGILYENLSI